MAKLNISERWLWGAAIAGWLLISVAGFWSVSLPEGDPPSVAQLEANVEHLRAAVSTLEKHVIQLRIDSVRAEKTWVGAMSEVAFLVCLVLGASFPVYHMWMMRKNANATAAQLAEVRREIGSARLLFQAEKAMKVVLEGERLVSRFESIIDTEKGSP